MATEMAGVCGAGGQGRVSLRSIVPVECKRRTSGPDCLTPAQAGGVSGRPPCMLPALDRVACGIGRLFHTRRV